jgi:hypothetical protein
LLHFGFRSVALLRALSLVMATPATETCERLLSVDTGVAETVALLMPLHTNLGHASLCFASWLQTEEILENFLEFSQHANGEGKITYKTL